ncbi:MAG: 16S rRNA (uracil(1498)-N(3))-methyltransferase [Candidatus Lambdaproteobacteria bacterium]|nr:16S rRNA (uracil(1498)-N(3))-methyltransferase [Candidatus Lambdaproteobacteria bacterium]
MTYFRCTAPLVPGSTLVLEGAEAAHLLQARRMRPGERFALQDGAGTRCLAELVAADRHRARVLVLAPTPVPAPPLLRLSLLQAAVKEKAAEWIVQKSTELGVAAVTFFPAARATVPLRQLQAAAARERLARIAWEACKQCDRQFPPELRMLPTLDVALAAARGAAIRWVLAAGPASLAPAAALAPAEGGATPAEGATATLLVGPEGGLTAEELAAARAAGFLAVTLGPNTLRAETAALAGCALLLCAGPVPPAG